MPPKSNTDSFTAQLQKGIKEINQNIEEKLEAHRKVTEEQICKALHDFENKIDGMVSKLKDELTYELTNMKSDIQHCYEFVKQIDKSTTNKLVEFEKSNNALMRRINRPDIIITGLPAALPNLMETILKLGVVYDIPLVENDVNHIMYIKSFKEVLVKFNTIAVRDKLMKKYYETRDLKLNDLIGGELSERVFLNDHLTPMANKLSFICRRLKRDKQITKFKFHNSDLPTVEITKNDGVEMKLNLFAMLENFPDFTK